MLFADYLVLFAVLLCTSVNRQSIFILTSFLLSELAFYLTWSDFSFSIVVACLYAYLAKTLKNIKYELQLALTTYSVLFWFNALDFWVTEQPTIFYVIFPYVIKAVDIYVIYHLINKGRRRDGIHSTSHCSFN